ncbi:CDGSH iron-sulfur domain-containing protein [Ottowia sp.]|uniref:CDGSH iron-sulfur domain-containing protein n=1 Tax=Ottowia sp. TaxID=1898956 RepID=UPI002631C960|nr:CDGSH iron-sulfur domain-containing protein [Ottowia sp.]
MAKPEYTAQIGTTAAPDRYWIKVTAGGPYIVHGSPPVQVAMIGTNESGVSEDYIPGKSFEVKEGMALCRCGHSRHSPFCDGSHLKAQVDLIERASFEPLLDNAQEIDGPALTLTDNERYCAFARFCDGANRVWNEVQMAGVAHERNTLHMTSRCPGGRLMVWDRQTRKPIEPAEPASIHPIEDPAEGCSGPLMVRGGVRVESADGQSYEIRNRQALCRCGQSSNKPFCDGTHASVHFQDGIG